MGSASSIEYRPSYAVPPGESLRETLDELGMTQAEFARRADLSTKHVNQIIKGEAAITSESAVAIERVTGVPSRIWMRLEARYRDQLLALAEEERLSSKAAEWIAKFPVRELAKRRWIDDASDKARLAQQLLSFFGVASIDAWAEWKEGRRVALLRQSGTGTTDEFALATWLRTGEIVAQRATVAPFDEATFRESFTAIRRSTRQPRSAVSEVQKICASAGVTFVVTDAFPRSRVSGASYWLAPSRPVIHLSRRYRRDDAFWFAFFHEAGHLLKHSKKTVHVDVDLDPTPAEGAESVESEANQFAVKALLEDIDERELESVNTLSDVLKLADRAEIAPSIIVGQLHHREMKPHSWGRQLIRDLRLPSDPDLESAP